MKRLIVFSLLLFISLFAQTNAVHTDELQVSGNANVTGNMSISGTLTSNCGEILCAVGKLVQATDSVYSITAADTYYEIGGWDSSHSAIGCLNVTVDSSENCLIINEGYDGHYLAIFSATLSCDDGGGEEVWMAIKKNGTIGNYSETSYTSKDANDIRTLTFVNSPILAAGDSLSLWMKTTGGGDEITLKQVNFILTLLFVN